jgi:acetyl esterase/lipase
VPCTSANTNNRFDVSYGASDLDIYPVPGGCATPVVVFVHGGGYCCGDKSQDIGPSIPWFHSQGWAVVSVNYRLHVQYPAFDDDVAAALAWLHANASSFGGNGSRLALFGHSTGAEMAAEIGTNPALQAAAGGVSCVAALDGYAYDVGAIMARTSASGRAVYTAAYGNTAAQWRAASAVTYATDDHHIPPFLVVLRGGDTGSLLPLQQGLADALRRAGVPVQTIDAESINHGQVIHDIGQSGDHVMTAPVQAFLQHSC